MLFKFFISRVTKYGNTNKQFVIVTYQVWFLLLIPALLLSCDSDDDCVLPSNECNTGVCDDLSSQCVFVPVVDGTACGDPIGDECTAPDSCEAGNCVPNDATAGTACGDQLDTECSRPDTCDGFGWCLENHEPEGTACGDQTMGSHCDYPDTCDGGGT